MEVFEELCVQIILSLYLLIIGMAASIPFIEKIENSKPHPHAWYKRLILAILKFVFFSRKVKKRKALN